MDVLRRFTGPAVVVLFAVYYLFAGLNIDAWAQALERSSDLYDASEYEEALLEAQRAVRRATTVFKLEPLQQQSSLNMLGLCYLALERYEQADAAFFQALGLSFRGSADADINLAMSGRGTVLNNLAQSNLWQGRYLDAEACASAALAIFDRTGSESRPLALVSLAEALVGLEAYDAALEHGLEAVAALDTESPEALNWLVDGLRAVSEAYIYLDRYVEVQAPLQQLIAIHEQQGEVSGMATYLLRLASVYGSLEDFTAAEQTYQRALGITQEQADEDALSSVLEEAAEFFLDRGLFADAIPLYERAIALNEQLYGEGNWAVKRQLNELGLSYAGVARYADAERVYLRCLDLLAVADASVSDRHAVMENLLAVYEQTGNEAAQDSLRAAMRQLAREQAEAEAAAEAQQVVTVISGALQRQLADG